MNARSWLTAKRVRIHGLLLAACLWTVYAADMSTPGLLDRNGLVKGTDFLHFYTLGNLALRGRGDLLYDMRAQAELARQFVTHAPDSLYVPLYGPQVSLFFAPFARLSYGWALTVWLFVNALIYTFCCCAVWKSCPNLQKYRWTVLILAIAFPGFFELLIWGQTSGLALLCFTLAYLALRRDQKLAGGIGVRIADLQAAVGHGRGGCICVRARMEDDRGRPCGSISPAGRRLDALRHVGLCEPTFGALLHMENVLPLLEPRLYQTHSLRSFWSLLVPSPQIGFGLYVVYCPRRSGGCRRLLAEARLSGSSVFGAVVRHGPCVTTFDRV